jgi:hypothetical protein
MSTDKPKKRGRPVGSKNKVSRDVKEIFRQLLDYNLSEAQIILDAIQSPNEKMKRLIDISHFFIAKQSATSINATLSRTAEDDEFYQLTKKLIIANNERLKQLEPPSQPAMQRPISIPIPDHKKREDGDDAVNTEWQEEY